jgi:hypothetical protein
MKTLPRAFFKILVYCIATPIRSAVQEHREAFNLQED